MNSTAKTICFINENRAELVEAIENHIEETKSLSEGADDDDYTRLNNNRNKLLLRFLKIITNE